MHPFAVEEPLSPQRRQVHARRLARGAKTACLGLAVLAAAYFAGVLTPIAPAVGAANQVKFNPLASRVGPAVSNPVPGVALPPHRSNGATVPVHPGMATGPQTAMDVELEELGEASKAKAKAWHSVYDPQMDATLGRVPGESLFRETHAGPLLAADGSPVAPHARGGAEDVRPQSVTQASGSGAPGAGGAGGSPAGSGSSSSAWTAALAGFIPGGESGESAPYGDSGSSAGARSTVFLPGSPSTPAADAGQTMDAAAATAARAGGSVPAWLLLFPAAFLLSMYTLYESRVDAQHARARFLTDSEVEPYAGSQRLETRLMTDSEVEPYAASQRLERSGTNLGPHPPSSRTVLYHMRGADARNCGALAGASTTVPSDDLGVSAVTLASDRGAALRSAGWSPVVFNSRVPAGGRTRLSAVRMSAGAAAAAAGAAQGLTVGEFGTPVKDVPKHLVEERDACGVGFIASKKNQRSHEILSRALHALGCMEHRGGCGGDGVSGDGAGVMVSLPWELFEKEGQLKGKSPDSCGVAMAFLPQNAEEARNAEKYLEAQAAMNGFEFLGWRDVPQSKNVLGPMALEALPEIRQAFLHHPTLRGDELEEALYKVRRSTQGDIIDNDPEKAKGQQIYFASLSSRTIVYKGMVMSCVLKQFYGDLENEDFLTNFAIYHRRFSTNTNPKWPLAQPMRILAHNGEINTLTGNVNWQRAFDKQRNRRDPLCSFDKSDTANLDSVFENNVLGNDKKTPAAALSSLVPEAYRDQPYYDDHPEIVDMYEYYAGMQEPWDGPALLIFCDGKQLGASLDRNGLRPGRYLETEDLIGFMSETGVIEVEDEIVQSKGRLGPGNMITLDLESGEFKENVEVKMDLASKAPYSEWLEKRRTIVEPQSFEAETEMEVPANIKQQLTAFGWSLEDVDMQVGDMANAGKETLFSLGEDTPLAVLSTRPHTLYDYFKQRFAQVTNPPIDPLREGIVMGLDMTLGARFDLRSTPAEEGANQLRITTPILNEGELKLVGEARKTVTISTLYPISTGPKGLEIAVKKLCEEAEQQVRDGAEVLVLSDRKAGGLCAEDTYIPPLLAAGAVHHHLINAGVRLKASIVSQTATCWSTHHIACLVGFGASAVHPYMLFATVKDQYENDKRAKMRERGDLSDISLDQSYKNVRKALEAGVYKIMSKIGISLLSSYHGAQIFEAIGVGADIMNTAFVGTPSRIGGLSFEDLAEEVTMWHANAQLVDEEKGKLNNYGFVKFYQKAEHHGWNPPMARDLHKALRSADVKGEGFDFYKTYMEVVETSPTTVIRDLLEIKSDRESIPLDEVEPVEAIMKRFCTGGMSLGALSREAHETLAIGVNRAGGRSNSGEGGEDEIRWQTINDVDPDGKSTSLPHLKGLRDGDLARSKVKQVASGRFGVTPAYLMNADQLEIKVAQGAKPGEGGQLPGAKVNPYIASIRACKVGVMLISPPPHHDIYSIEDLAQLIYDLHQINPTAKVSVKLVGQVGIGTVASGVAKADADIIQISGHDGGTGASPLTSIKHAGGPWELGLSEAHQQLILNGLRDRVVLRVDGGLKTGHDVMIGALMGAEEFGFGTIAMIATGCIAARICHTNNCPVGVTTQKEKLRKKFNSVPEDMYNFFYYAAEEVRNTLAHMGYKSLSDVVGRADLLQQRQNPDLVAKTPNVDLQFVRQIPVLKTAEERAALVELEKPHAQMDTLDDELLAREDVQRAINNHEHVTVESPINNLDRCATARVTGTVAKLHGNRDWRGSLHFIFTGCAGQSFGFACLPGMDFEVRGDANDYVGKSMHGGRIRIRPVDCVEGRSIGFDASKSIIVGNTCLYGATGGRFFAAGGAGERFAVRNSNAKAVVEGAGDHCCEYMTGGVVVVLGPTGRNVGAGQTGGWGYFLEDEEGYSLNGRINGDVNVQPVNAVGAEQLRSMIEEHVEATDSKRGRKILENWDAYLPKFKQVFPSSEAEAPEVSGIAVESPRGEAVLA